METVRVKKIPRCDCCHEKDAVYDSKTKYGPHAYLCQDCYQLIGCPPSSKLEEPPELDVAKTDEVPTVHISIKAAATSSVVRLRCPHCGEIKRVEPDANYTTTCDVCGNQFKVVSPI